MQSCDALGCAELYGLVTVKARTRFDLSAKSLSKSLRLSHRRLLLKRLSYQILPQYLCYFLFKHFSLYHRYRGYAVLSLFGPYGNTVKYIKISEYFNSIVLSHDTFEDLYHYCYHRVPVRAAFFLYLINPLQYLRYISKHTHLLNSATLYTTTPFCIHAHSRSFL